MLTLLTGLPGSGKTTKIFQKIAENGTDRQQYCLVPEAQLHAMQRRLCQSCGNAASLYAQVLTLPKLADALIREDSTAAGAQLTQAERLLHMHQAMETVAPRLQLYARYCHRPAFLQRVLATLGTLDSCGVVPKALLTLAENPGFSKRLRMKLQDLGLILGEYRAITAHCIANRQDRLAYLLQLLQRNVCLAEADVYLLGFLRFTAQEMEILQEICKQAHSLTISLLCEDPSQPTQATEFQLAHGSIQALRRFAAQAAIPCQVEYLPLAANAAPLPWLREHWCAPANATWATPTQDLVLFTGESTLEQAEFAAQTILQLLQQGYRYRQIGLAVRGVQAWAEELSHVFHGYDIPLQLPAASAASTQPLLVGVASALEAVGGGFQPNDILRYLKSGIFPIPEAELSALENYIHTWGIQGETWTRAAAWSWHPKGYGETWHTQERATLAALDSLRRQLMAPFAPLQAPGTATGADWAQRLYAFLQALGLPETLAGCEPAEEAAWELLCETMEQCAQQMAQSSLSLQEFSTLFVYLLRQASGSSTQQTLDQVQLFEATQPTGQAVACLFVLGAESHAFPQVASGAGLFTNQDLECLAQCLPTMTTADQAAQQELAALYRLVTLPQQKLLVCHSAYNAEGTAQQPSILLTKLARLFPNCRKAQPPASTQASATVALPQERLSPALVQQLYGKIPTFSASSIDTFQGCHFAYFMKQGLKAKAQEVASFGSNHIGSYYHYILEQVLQQTSRQGSLKGLQPDELVDLALQKATQYDAQLQLEEASEQTKCIVQRIRKDIKNMIQNVAEELQKSDFVPTAFELRFGPGADSKIQCSIHTGEQALQLTGMVDRVDTWQADGKTYYRIIDYKSNGKDIQFEKLWEGLGLQMLIYLFAIESAGMGEGPDDRLTPAGVLYLPLSHVIITEDKVDLPQDDEEASQEKFQASLQSEITEKLRRTGFLLNNEKLINAMEHESYQAGKSSQFLPVWSKNKHGIPVATPQAYISEEQLALLRQHVQAIYAQLAQNLAAGKVAPNPYYISAYANACQYCDYAPACHFTPGQHGLDYRYISTMNAETFWGKLGNQYSEAVPVLS